MRYTSLGFIKGRRDLKDAILLPRYYNPEIVQAAEAIGQKHKIVSLGALADQGALHVGVGHEVGKMAYGTGDIPFIRTSDITGWELKADPKHSVSEAIYNKYRARQDIRAGDILMVRDGTYLIGSTTLVRQSDLPLVLQSHVLRLRFDPESGMDPEAWQVALGSPFVKMQLRAIQFTADIIDTIGERWREVKVPIPVPAALEEISAGARNALANRDGALATLGALSQNWCNGIDAKLVARYNPYSRTESRLRSGFIQQASTIQRSILVPRYYDPDIDAVTKQLSKTHKLVNFRALERRGAVEINTGIEVGKMAYGTGDIPFVRTADLANQEVKPDPKQGVSQEIWEQNKQDVQPYDILLVRDGTYLVGSTALVAEDQVKMLYCGGLYRIRATDESVISPEELLVVLNSNYVRAQMRARQFTRDIIDTLGRRLMEIQLPLLKDENERASIRSKAREAIDSRARARFDLSRFCATFPDNPG